jgi:hypothetical protein
MLRETGDWPNLIPLIGGTLNIKLMEQQFDEVMRLTAWIKPGTVTASLILRKLAAYPRQNSLAMGLREYGRLERTLFTLKWLRDGRPIVTPTYAVTTPPSAVHLESQRAKFTRLVALSVLLKRESCLPQRA